MTFGTRIEGSLDSAFYRLKSWSGGDGKYNSNGDLNWHSYTVNAETTTKVKSIPWLPYFPNGLWIGGTGESAHLVEANWGANDQLKLYSKLADKVRGHSFNLGVTAAELPQSLKLAAVNIRRISQALNAVKHGRIDQALRVLGTQPSKSTYLINSKGKTVVLNGQRKLVSKDISAAWLEIQYGWMPAVKDIYEAMSAFSAIMDSPRKSRVVATTRRVSKSQYITPGSQISNRKTTRTTGRIVYEMTELMSVTRSLGLENPASVLWEKTPWSFVFDWAVPIGSYIEALGVIPQLSGKFCQTVKRETNSVGVGTNRPYKGASVTSRSISLVREIPASLYVPTPEFQPLPKILSVGHVLNALALLHQVARDPKVPLY